LIYFNHEQINFSFLIPIIRLPWYSLEALNMIHPNNDNFIFSKLISISNLDRYIVMLRPNE